VGGDKMKKCKFLMKKCIFLGRFSLFFPLICIFFFYFSSLSLELFLSLQLSLFIFKKKSIKKKPNFQIYFGKRSKITRISSALLPILERPSYAFAGWLATLPFPFLS
jgi:hypothetical protein